MAIKCYFLYGPSGSGKTLTAHLLSEYYGVYGSKPFQPFTKNRSEFSFRGYRGEEVILIDNDMYRGREFHLYIMLTNWYQCSPIKRSGYVQEDGLHERFQQHWQPPSCIVICSYEEPNEAMLKVLRETYGVCIRYHYTAFQNVLSEIEARVPDVTAIIDDIRCEQPERLNEEERPLCVTLKDEKKPKRSRQRTITDFLKKSSTVNN